jgi:cell shape-determining protein MreD
MKEKLLRLANVSLFAFAILVLGTLQTSLWFQIFGYFPGPAFWLPCLIYIALFRSTLETVIFAYITGFILSTMTAMPEGVLMIVCVSVAVSAQLLKQRIYWSATSYVMMTCGLAALLFHLVHWCISYLVGSQPITSPEISDWLIEALLTPLVAPALFPMFRWFDRITQRDQSSEISAQVA